MFGFNSAEISPSKSRSETGTRINKCHTAPECGNDDLQDYFLLLLFFILLLGEDGGRLGRVGNDCVR